MGNRTVRFNQPGLTVLPYFVLSRSVRELHQSKSAFILYEARRGDYVNFNFEAKSSRQILTVGRLQRGARILAKMCDRIQFWQLHLLS